MTIFIPALGSCLKKQTTAITQAFFISSRKKAASQPPDQLTLNLDLDDKLLRGIIKGLYYPESPYVFSELPADVLGQVYEQFLGKVIRLTEGHHAKVEDKPEVKKAGGVYYTPTYIVEYIVENTMGKLLEGKTPKQAVALRILDPACGSGSFLLSAINTCCNGTSSSIWITIRQNGPRAASLRWCRPRAAAGSSRLRNASASCWRTLWRGYRRPGRGNHQTFFALESLGG